MNNQQFLYFSTSETEKIEALCAQYTLKKATVVRSSVELGTIRLRPLLRDDTPVTNQAIISPLRGQSDGKIKVTLGPAETAAIEGVCDKYGIKPTAYMRAACVMGIAELADRLSRCTELHTA